MHTKVLLLLVAVPALVVCRPTHCERHKGDSEFRCGKDDYRADRVHIKNIAGADISFKVGKWLSQCGRPGVNYATDVYNLGRDNEIDVDFGEARSGACNELFVYDCKKNNASIKCLTIVSVYPN